jgi:hypothetical protein
VFSPQGPMVRSKSALFAICDLIYAEDPRINDIRP